MEKFTNIHIELSRDLRLLQRLEEASDDGGGAVGKITENDVTSKRGEALLKKLTIDDYLPENSQSLAEELTLYAKALQKNAWLKRGDFWACIEGERPEALFLGVRLSHEYSVERAIAYVEKSVVGKQAAYQSYLKKNTRTDPEPLKQLTAYQEDLKFLTEISQTHKPALDQLSGLIAAKSLQLEAQGQHDYSLLGPIFVLLSLLRPAIESGPEEFFALLAQCGPDVDIYLRMLSEVQPKSVAEVKVLLPALQRYRELTGHETFFFNTTVGIVPNPFYDRETLGSQEFVHSPLREEKQRKEEFDYYLYHRRGISDSKNYVGWELSVTGAFKSHPDEVVRTLAAQTTWSDRENELYALGVLARLKSELQDADIALAARVFQGIPGEVMQDVFDSRSPETFAEKFLQPTMIERRGNQASMGLTPKSEAFFNCPEGPLILMHISDILTRPVELAEAIQGAVVAMNAGVSPKDLLTLAEKFGANLRAAFFGLTLFPGQNAAQVMEFLHWTVEIDQSSQFISSEFIEQGGLTGCLILAGDPKLRTTFTEKYGEDACFAVLGTALALVSPQRLAADPATLPSPLPVFDKRAADLADFCVSFARARRAEFDDRNNDINSELILLNQITAGDTKQSPRADWPKLAEGVVALLRNRVPLEKLSEMILLLRQVCSIDAKILMAVANLKLGQDVTEAEARVKVAAVLAAIQEASGQDPRQVNASQLASIQKLAAFFLALGRAGSLFRTAFVQGLDFSVLTAEAKDFKLHDTVAIARELDQIDKGLGQSWLRKLNPAVTPPTGTTLEITPQNLPEFFDQAYACLALGLSIPPLTFSGFESQTITSLKELLLMLEDLSKLAELPGGNVYAAEATRALMQSVDWAEVTKAETLDGVQLFNLQWIENLRVRVNRYTNNVAGDELVLGIAQGFVNLPLKREQAIALARFAKVWSQTRLLRTDHLRDVEGRYLMAATWAADKARGYIEANYREFYGTPELGDLENDLSFLGYPLREEMLQPVLDGMGTEKKKTVPVRTRVQPKSEVLSKLTPEEAAFVQSLSALSPSEIVLSNPHFSDVRLDELASIESLRLRMNTLSQTTLGDEIVLTLINNELKKPLDPSRLEIELRIFTALRAVKLSDPFGSHYRDLATFMGNRLVTYIRFNQTELSSWSGYGEAVQTLAAKGFTLPQDVSDQQKTLYHIQQGNWGYISGKLYTKSQAAYRNQTGASDIDNDLQSGVLKRQEMAGSLAGFTTEKITIGGQHVATLMTGSRAQGARVAARVLAGGGIKESDVSTDYGDTIAFQAPVTLVSGNGKGVDLMTSGGRVLNPSFDPRGKDGYLIITPAGQLRIADKWALKLSDLTGNARDASVLLKPMENAADFTRMMDAIRSHHLTILTSLLFEYEGRAGRYTQEASGNDSRRYILQFADGRFGMIDSEADMSINSLLALSYRLGAVKAVYCDTGMYDRAAYYTYPGGAKSAHYIGWQDAENSSNRIIFYTEKSLKP